MKTIFDEYQTCNSKDCSFWRKCAQHSSAGEFRSEGGFTPKLEVFNGVFNCLTADQPRLIMDGKETDLPRGYDNLKQGFIALDYIKDKGKTGKRPISPADVQKNKNTTIPDFVVEAFNKLITKNWTGTKATIAQEEVLKEIVTGGITRADVFNNNWLDIEDLFRKEGWCVTYDKPGYNETYDATFYFKPKD